MPEGELRGWRLQLAIVLLAGALWSLIPGASFAALVLAYAAAWILANLARAFFPSMLALRLTRAQAIGLSLLLAAAPLVRGAQFVERFLEEEGLDALDHYTAARLRLERTPSIFPPVYSADRPQTFYVHAPDTSEVVVRFGPIEASARELGHGLFRVEVDPREAETEGDVLAVEIVTDGEAHTRELEHVRPLPHPRWLRPSPDRRRAATVSEETDEVVVVSREGLALRQGVGDGPVDVAFVNERLLAVAHTHAPELWILDSESGATEREVEVGPFAVHLAVSGNTVAITMAGETPEIVLVDASTGRVTERVALDFTPDWIAFASRRDSNDAVEGSDSGAGSDDTDLDSTPSAETEIDESPEEAVARPADLVVSARLPAALHRLRHGEEGYREDRPPLMLGRPVVTLAAAGGEVVIAVTDYQPEGPAHRGNHFVQDQLLTVDVETWTVRDAERTAIRTSRQESPGSVDRGVSPMGIDLLPDGTRWVAFAGTDDVWRTRPGEVLPDFFEMDEHPLATPISAVGLADGAFAVSSAAYGAIGIFSSSGRRLSLVRLAPHDRELLRDDEHALQRRIGERSFYESTRSGVSCQACHLHGGSDGARHNIGGGVFVATLDTRGAAGTPPYLRDGGYPLLGSLDELAQSLYRGYLRQQGGRRVSLDRYLVALARPTPPRQLEGRDEARERRGLDLFVRARCALCHAFPAFTNLGQHPAETLFPRFAASHPGYQIDTPSLLGLGASEPFLVDGRAVTLRDVFREHDPVHRHGDTRELDDEELDDLIHFLEGL